MRPLFAAFSDELVKTAGPGEVLARLGRGLRTVGSGAKKVGRGARTVGRAAKTPVGQGVTTGALMGGLALAQDPDDKAGALRQAAGWGGGEFLGRHLARTIGATGKWGPTLGGWLGGQVLADRLDGLAAKHHERAAKLSPEEDLQARLAKLGAPAAPQSHLLQSSNLKGVRYESKTKDLYVTFKNGSTYKYLGVPPHVFRSLRKNKSPGRTLNKRVKGGGFEYEKQASTCMVCERRPATKGVRWAEGHGIINCCDHCYPKEKARLEAKDDYSGTKDLTKKGDPTWGKDLTAKERFVVSRSGKNSTAILERLREKHRKMRKSAGEAKKQVSHDGLPLKIEHEPGDIRSGVHKATGEKWERKMHCSYGFVPGTKGKGEDGDALDVYLASEPVSGAKVYKISQLKQEGGLDEHKYMLGHRSAKEAKEEYLRHMPSWAFGSLSELDMDDFKEMCGQGRKAA